MEDNKRSILFNVYLVYIAVALIGLAIIGKTIYIQTVEGDKWREEARRLSLRYENIEPVRGNILCSDGSLLASSVPIFELRFDAGNTYYEDEFFYSRVDSLAQGLSKVFGDRSKGAYKDILVKGRKSGNRYVLLKRNVTYDQLKLVRKLPILNLGKYKGGLVAEARHRREIPYKWLAYRTIGWDKEGSENDVGLEGAYSKELSGESGRRLMHRIGNGAWRPLNQENEIEPSDGADIVTTLDINIQDVAEDALMRQLIANEADHGCAILMEVATGHVLAIANLGKNKKGEYEENYNYAVGESSEPGSTFKLASLMAALDEGLADTSDIVNTNGGAVKYSNRIMRDSHRGGYGQISVSRAFQLSSNTGVSLAVHRAFNSNPQKFVDKLNAMHLDKPLGIDIPGEAKPRMSSPKSTTWSKVSLPWMSIGYEVAITPLQTLALYNAVANNGKMVKPLFVKEIRQKGMIVDKSQPVVLKNNIVKNAETIKQTRRLLEQVVERGTGTSLKNPYYKVAGKTGTAQIAQGSGGYNKSNYKASFVGYFPADNPKYSCIVVINNPTKGVYYGGAISAPVFREIADKVYATRLIAESNQPDSIIKSFPLQLTGKGSDIATITRQLAWRTDTVDSNGWMSLVVNDSTNRVNKRPVKENQVPNVTGMGARDAIFLLENQGIAVKVTGKGLVKNQSLTPGTPVRKGTLCVIELG